MKPMPAWPPIALALVALGVVIGAACSEAQMRGLYEVAWKDGGAAIAGVTALAAAFWAARPVYRQMRLQNAQAALALLPLVERDLAAIDRMQRALIDLWMPPATMAKAIHLGSGNLKPTREKKTRLRAAADIVEY